MLGRVSGASLGGAGWTSPSKTRAALKCRAEAALLRREGRRTRTTSGFDGT